MGRERSQQIAGSDAHPRAILPACGILYVVSVPIGHPDDITLRALRVLQEVDFIISENPAATQRLLSHHRLNAIVTSYGPRNLKEKVAVFIHRLLKGARAAVVSDCGSPVIADPGQRLIALARCQGIPVLSVPGPSALTAVVSISGRSGESFCFRGELPRTRSAMERCLKRVLRNQESTVVFCECKYLLIALDSLRSLAPARRIVLAVDLTRPGETLMSGTARQVQRRLSDQPPVEDATLMIAGRRGRTQRKNY